MKKILLFSLMFSLLFGSVLGVSAADDSTITLGNEQFVDIVYGPGGSAQGTIKEYAKNNGWTHIIYTYDSSKILTFMSGPVVYDGGLVAGGDINTFRFKYVGGVNPGFKYQDSRMYSYGDTVNSVTNYEVRWSSFDVEYSTGGLYFDGDQNFLVPPPPLAEIVAKGSEEALKDLGITLGGTVKVLVLCGVGCLALLVALKLFGKRSLIFRR